MTAPDPMLDLARRAAQSEHFRGLPGMRALLREHRTRPHAISVLVHSVSPGGWMYAVHFDTLDPIRDDANWTGLPPGTVNEDTTDGAVVLLPDLTDPATLGCLLALVREAWGAACWVAPDVRTHADEPETWTVYVFRGGFACDVAGEGETEAAALVAALLAAPAKEASRG